MINNTARIGCFTSSEIYRLLKEGKTKGSFGVPALTYIDEKKTERRLGRSLSTDVSSRDMSWGTLIEKFVFDNVLGTEYRLCSLETVVHPEIPEWAGSPDAETEDTIADVKGLQLKSFCQIVDAGTIEKIRDNHIDGDKFFWQLTSNAVLRNKRYAELIAFVPYKSQLQDIRDLALNWDGENQSRFMWINYATDAELPYLIEGGHYKNLNIIRWEVSAADRKLITAKVTEAAKELHQLEPVTA